MRHGARAVQSLDDAGNPELDDMMRRFRVSLALTLPILVFMISDVLPRRPMQHVMSPPAMTRTRIRARLADRVAAERLAVLRPRLGVGGEPPPEHVHADRARRRRRLRLQRDRDVGAGLFPASFRGHGDQVAVYFEPAAVIVTLVLLGEVLGCAPAAGQARRSRACSASRRRRPVASTRRARRTDVPLAHVHVGDRLRVRPGERIPVDGVVLEGSTSVDESMVTGDRFPSRRRQAAASPAAR